MFLTLVFLALLGFISVVISSSKDINTRNELECISDASIRSVFSEYNKYLFEKYGLLYVDTSYRGIENGGTGCFESHVSRYVDANLDGVSVKDIVPIQISVSETCYASDDTFRSVERQIRTYMLEKYGMNEYADDETILNTYISLKMPDDFYDYFDDDGEECISISYDDKLSEVLRVITEDIRQNANGYFSFSDQLESTNITIKYEDSEGKIYDYSRFYSLNI